MWLNSKKKKKTKRQSHHERPEQWHLMVSHGLTERMLLIPVQAQVSILFLFSFLLSLKKNNKKTLISFIKLLLCIMSKTPCRRIAVYNLITNTFDWCKVDVKYSCCDTCLWECQCLVWANVTECWSEVVMQLSGKHKLCSSQSVTGRSVNIFNLFVLTQNRATVFHRSSPSWTAASMSPGRTAKIVVSQRLLQPACPPRTFWMSVSHHCKANTIVHIWAMATQMSRNWLITRQPECYSSNVAVISSV